VAALVRVNPETPCQPAEAHHPHRWVCVDLDCGCDYLDGEPYRALRCCVCNQDWPCPTKQQHEQERRERSRES